MSYNKEYYYTHKQKQLDANKRYYSSIQGKIMRRKGSVKRANNITDCYIRQTIWGSIYLKTGEKIDRSKITQEQIEKYREHIKTRRKLQQFIKNQKTMETQVKELTSTERRSLSMKESWEKRRNATLTDGGLATLIEASVAPKTKEISKAIPITSKGALELLFEDLKSLTEKKQEILNHLEAIKQLLNQF